MTLIEGAKFLREGKILRRESSIQDHYAPCVTRAIPLFGGVMFNKCIDFGCHRLTYREDCNIPTVSDLVSNDWVVE